MIKYFFKGKVQLYYSKSESNPIQFINLRKEFHDLEVYKYCITLGGFTIFWGE